MVTRQINTQVHPASVVISPEVIAVVVVAKVGDAMVVETKVSVAKVVAANVSLGIRSAFTCTSWDAFHNNQPRARRPPAVGIRPKVGAVGHTLQDIQRGAPVPTGLGVSDRPTGRISEPLDSIQ